MAINATIRIRAISKDDLNALLEMAEEAAARVVLTEAFPTNEAPRTKTPAEQLRVKVVRIGPKGVERTERVVHRGYA